MYIYRNLFIYSHIVARYCEIRVTVLGCGWDDFGNDFDSHSHKAGKGYDFEFRVALKRKSPGPPCLTDEASQASTREKTYVRSAYTCALMVI